MIRNFGKQITPFPKYISLSSFVCKRNFQIIFVAFFRVYITLKSTFLHLNKTCVYQSLSPVQLFVTPQTEAHQDSLSIEFFRQEYWSRLPFPSPGDLTNPGIQPKPLTSPALADRFFTTSIILEALLYPMCCALSLSHV